MFSPRSPLPVDHCGNCQAILEDFEGGLCVVCEKEAELAKSQEDKEDWRAYMTVG